MCGIVALFRRDGGPVLQEEIVAMRDILTHRGPDDAGLFLDDCVGLGHRRLRIIDLAGGHQPMANERGTVHLVFNGEIYNYQELRTLLQARGVRLRTHSDTETILGLYDLFGEDCVHHLRGMFAFVLWDSARRRLIAARDRLGIKPLYILRRGTTVALVSEIKALLAVPEWTPRLAEDNVYEYLLYRNLAGTRTMFRDVERIAPGEVAVFTQQWERRQRYWTLPLPVSHAEARRSADDWADELEHRLEQVVGQHLASDVPLGTFLSGGIDSSLVTAFAAGIIREPLHTYSVGFAEPDLDESPYAAAVAQTLGAQHHSRVVSEQEYADWLPRAIWYHDEPLGHPHCVHIHYLSRLARDEVTVVLTGEGSDELFAGYTRYRLLGLLDRAPLSARWVRRLLAAAAGRVDFPSASRIRALFDGGNDLCVERLAAFLEPGEVRRVHLGRAMSLGARDVSVVDTAGLLARALLHDQQIYLEALLNRLDKMSMSTSLEGRVPFLDHELVEFVATIPPQLKLRGLRTKYVLKHLARRHLEPRIVDRRKVGFGIPLASWMRGSGPLVPYMELLLDPAARTRGYLDREEVQRTIHEHRSGARDHSELLWGLFNLELWHRVMLDNAERHKRLALAAVRDGRQLDAVGF